MCITNPLKISNFQGNLLHMLLFSQKHAFYFSILRIKEGLSHVQQPLLRRKVDHNGLVVCISTDAIKRKEPIIRVPAGCGLSALRLCVWLFDNGYIELFYMDQGFLPTFRTE